MRGASGDASGGGGGRGPPPNHTTLRARVACWFYAARGRCRFGAACRYSHDAGVRAGAAVPGTAGREWVAARAAPPAATPALTFRVLSYNTLADGLAFKHAPELYRAVPQGVLPWRARVAGLRAELGHHGADVVCLQEVDRAADVAGFLRAAGYDTAYAPRTGGRADGCLTAWRRGRFELAAPPRTLAMADHGLKDNVALIVALRSVGPAAGPSAPTLLIANTHLLFNPKRGDVKLGQARTLLHAMRAAAAGAGATHALLAGDFNATPGSAVYEFVARGRLALGDHDRRALSGQLVGSGAVAAAATAAAAALASSPAGAAAAAGDVDTDDEFDGKGDAAAPPPPPPPAYYDPMVLDAPRSRTHSATTTTNNSWTLDQLHAAAGAPAAPAAAGASLADGWVATHPLRLASAYATAAGAEPAFTSAHSRFIGTVDYVWFTPDGVVVEDGAASAATRLHPTRVLAPPPLASLPGGLPSPDYPSDHVSVVVDFVAVQQ